MVKEIAEVSGRKISESTFFTPAVYLGSKMPGKIGGLVNKAFGNLTYDQKLSDYPGMDYRVVSLKESIVRTEGKIVEKREPCRE
jgi:UDP-glucose 4-epimerase